MKEVSFNKIESVIRAAEMPKQKTVSYDVGSEHIEFEVKTALTLQERTDMAFEIADMIFPEGDNALYIPSFEDYAHAFTVLKYYTNIKVSSNVERTLAFERAAHVVEAVQGVAGDEPEKIFADADNIVRHRRQYAAHSKAVFDRLGEILNGVSSDSKVPIDEILRVLDKASDVDEEKLSAGVLKFRAQPSAENEQTGESEPIILTKAEAK